MKSWNDMPKVHRKDGHAYVKYIFVNAIPYSTYKGLNEFKAHSNSRSYAQAIARLLEFYRDAQENEGENPNSNDGIQKDDSDSFNK